MVSGKAVNDIQVLPEGIHVLPRAQHGAYLHFAQPKCVYIILTQEEVVGGHLTCHLDAFLFSSSDYLDLLA